MVEIVIEMGRKAFIALGIMLVAGRLFSDLMLFGESIFQTNIVFAFYIYTFAALFGPSNHRLFHVLSIPILTQFLHLFQKYSFTAGANSLWRLLPFLLLSAYFISFFSRIKAPLSKNEKLFLLLWLVSQLGFLVISPNLPHIAFGGLLFYLVMLPLTFVYLHYLSQASDFQPKLEMYLCLLYLILGLGTFGLIFAGVAYKGADNLLVTRNISDTNVTMAYFILLWPFTLMYFRHSRLPNIVLLAFLAILIGIVIFSFSRGAVFIITPYLIISTLRVSSSRQILSISTVAILILLFSKEIDAAFQDQGLGYSWGLRFGGEPASSSVIQKLRATSGRAEIHDIAYHLFLKKSILGHGTGSFEVLGPGYREAHSLFYTLLAEQGIVGALFLYLTLGMLGASLLRIIWIDKRHALLILSLIFYLIFNHTVGSVFVIIPGKSVTINCIAPILLLCLYFYSKSVVHQSGNE